MSAKGGLVCPKCGSESVIRIQYGLPSHDALEAVGRGEVILGGCCIGGNSPQYHCKECQNEWGKMRIGGEIYDDIVSFQAEVGGHLRECYFVTADWETKKLSYQVGSSAKGYVTKFERELKAEGWQQLIENLKECSFVFWLDQYEDHTVLDGTQWSVRLKLTDGEIIEKAGDNSFPAYWEKFCTGIAELVGERFE
ncbi:MAG TPA: hypothetical protein PLZ08_11285 [Bacillota bacterium]|jgi:hypothetical protein|nr:hypothetical protein [Bacillota bacterium]HOL10721.1 hypothetical protein [Bacillota bacterium]HPO98521.1 hypothetical protein [Bacillota bacterium]